MVKKIIFSIVITLFVFSIVFTLGEILITVFNPQQIIYPSLLEFSPQYGHIYCRNCKTISKLPGKWEFAYTINKYRYRGKEIPLSNSYDKTNIIILGDSNSMGVGVNDGEEYAAVMADNLKEHFNVINLGVGGWGLTEEIRRFYEFGQLYLPKLVILQFSSNDPDDNIKKNKQVTKVENDKFIFQDISDNDFWLEKYLSNSIIQKSQIYNIFRYTYYIYFTDKEFYWHIKGGKVKHNKEKKVMRIESTVQNDKKQEISLKEKLYNDLLELFAKDLNRKGIKLLMITVNRHLNRFTYIKEKVYELESKKLLDYYEVTEWFKKGKDYRSPEGHDWGKEAHFILGTKLSELIKSTYFFNSISLKD